MTGTEIKTVAAILKKRFTNLSVDETLTLAIEILEGIGR